MAGRTERQAVLSRRQPPQLIAVIDESVLCRPVLDAPGHPSWRKSTRSGGDDESCVEVADNLPGVVLVRDTKDRDDGILHVDAASWRSFVDLAKRIGPRRLTTLGRSEHEPLGTDRAGGRATSSRSVRSR